MKANEAPEKIYVTECMLFPTNPEITLPKNDSIEYIRTDAFIEKVEEYLQEHLIDYWSQIVTNESNFVEGFQKYMKGE